MKKILTLLLSISISCLAFGATSEVVVDQITYQCNSETNTATITTTNNTLKGKVIIPGTVQGTDGLEYSVTIIGEFAFTNCNEIIDMHLPSSITTIQNGAFINCTNLKYINIPENTTFIGGEAFGRDNGNTTINTIESQALVPPTADYAFWEIDYNKIRLRVPAESLEKYKAANVWKEFAHIKAGSVETRSKDGFTYIIDPAEKTAILAKVPLDITGSVTIPENVPSKLGTTCLVTTVGRRAFELCSEITEIHLPSSITTIDDYAFSTCEKLTYINIPANTTTIGFRPFDSCRKIQTIECYAQNPPKVDDDFVGELYSLTTVIVPYGSLTAYKNANWWKDFNKLKESPVEIYTNNHITYEINHDTNAVTVAKADENSQGEITILKTVPSVNGQPYSVTTINQNAFTGCSEITKIHLPSSITTIKDQAFTNCTNLTYINVPANTTSFGNNVFEGCANLQTIECSGQIPPTVNGTELGSDGLYQSATLVVPYSSLTDYQNAEIWKKFASIESGPTETVEHDEITYVIDFLTQTATVTKTSQAKRGKVTIPATVTGSNEQEYPVTIVGTSAFEECFDIIEIHLPTSITTIKDRAFMWCVNLRYINIPANTESIGENALEACPLVQAIESYAQVPPRINGKGLSETDNSYQTVAAVRVPNGSLTAYQDDPIWGQFADIKEGSIETVVQDEISYIIDLAEKTAIVAKASDTKKGSVIIPETVNASNDQPYPVTKVGIKAFLLCPDITEIHLPSSITTIRNQAFNGYRDLTYINIPENTIAIGSNLFGPMTNDPIIIESQAKIPPYIEHDTFDRDVFENDLLAVPKGCLASYQNAEGWKDFVKMKEGPIEIYSKDEIIYIIDCTEQTATVAIVPKTVKGSIIIPENVTTSNSQTNPVTTVGTTAFSGCYGITEIHLPTSITTIKNKSFDGCSELVCINIPTNTTSIGEYALNGCENLQIIESYAQVPPIINGKGLCETDNFYQTVAVRVPNGSLTVYQDVPIWGQFADIKEGSIETIVQDEITYLIDLAEKTAFVAVASNTIQGSVTIPETVKATNEQSYPVSRVCKKAFFNCKEITEIHLPSAITTIEDEAFLGSWNLTHINIPANTTTIGANILWGCGNLQTIESYAQNPPTVNTDGFTLDEDFYKNVTVTVPYSTTDSYRGAEIWNKFTNIKERVTETVNKEGITYAIDFPTQTASVFRVAQEAQDKVVILETVPSNNGQEYPVTKVGREAFEFCPKITEIHLPSSITTIEDMAFGACTRLQTIKSCATIPPTVNGAGLGSDGLYQSAKLVVPYNSLKAYQDAEIWNKFATIESGPTETVVHDEITYVIDFLTQTATVTKTSQAKRGKVTIPQTVQAANNQTYPVTTIGSFAFDQCRNIIEIQLPSSITTIKEKGFQACWNLAYINIPENTTSIADRAFWECSKLQTIQSQAQLPPIVTGSMLCEQNTFDQATLRVPSGSLADYQKANGWTQFKNVETEATYTYSKDEIFYEINPVTYTATIIGIVRDIKGIITIPENVPGKLNAPCTVTAVEIGAFSNCYDITEVHLPSSITTIKDRAFNGCGSLIYINIPASTTSMGDRIFEACQGLQTIESQVQNPPLINGTELGWDDLYQNTVVNVPSGSLSAYKEAKIWKKFANIKEGAIKTYTLNKITYVVDLNTNTATVAKAEKELTGNVTIPAFIEVEGGTTYSVITIGKNAFNQCENIIELHLPTSITSINDRAFDGCRSLIYINIPENTTSLGEMALGNCSALQTIESQAMVPPVISGYGLCDHHMQDAITLRVPKGTLKDYQNAEVWKNFRNIKEGFIETYSKEGITYIIDLETKSATVAKALVDTKGKVTILETVPGKLEATYPVTTIGKESFRYCTEITEIHLPSTITSIKQMAFESCTNLTSINIPANTTSVEGLVFGGCTGLKTIKCFGQKPPLVNDTELGWQELYSSAKLIVPYSSLSAYQQDKVWGKFTTIESGPTETVNKDNITYVIDLLTKTATVSQVAMEKEGKVIIPETVTGSNGQEYPVTIVGESAFGYNSSIVEIHLPSTITTIKDEACASCSSLEYINIPESTTSIGMMAFEGTNLYVIESQAIQPPVVDNAFDSYTHTTSKLRVPVGSLDAYKAANGWKEFGDIKEGSIEFYSKDKITYLIDLASNTATAFYTNDRLTGSVTIPENVPSVLGTTYPVTTIGGNALGGHADITEIHLPSTITTIEHGAFISCSNLTYINIPASTTTIGENVFGGCTSLQNIESFPQNPPTINGQELGFPEMYKSATLTVPYSSLSAYQQDEVWGKFTTIESGPTETVEKDGFTYVIDLLTKTATVSQVAMEKEGKVTIPETVIGSNNQEYPVTIVGFNAFMMGRNITEIHLPSSITTIKDGAFEGCYNLVYINIPENTIAFGVDLLDPISAPWIIESQAMAPPTINDMTFNREVLQNSILVVPKGSLDDYQKANGWKDFANIKEGGIETYSQNGISYIIDLDEETASIVKASDTLSISVTIPENVKASNSQTYPVTTIGARAFENCQYITEIHLPSTITSIGDYAFALCAYLTYINIPANTESLGENIFNACNKLETINSYAQIPPKINGWGFSWDEDFYNTTSVRVPKGSLATYQSTLIWENFTNIKEGFVEFYTQDDIVYLLDYATNTATVTKVLENLTDSITIPETVQGEFKVSCPVTAIGNDAFVKQMGITELHLPTSISSIGDFAFVGCENMTYINIPANTTSIGQWVFDMCLSLQTIESYAAIPPTVNGEGFSWEESFYTNVTVTVPRGSLERYKADPIWGKFTKLEESPIETVNLDDITYEINHKTNIAIVAGALEGIEGSITIPEIVLASNNQTYPVTLIGNRAFEGCRNIEEIYLPSSITTIKDSAFINCTNLRSINIPVNTTIIGKYIFDECTSLQTIKSYVQMPPVVDGEGFSRVEGFYENVAVSIPYGSLIYYRNHPIWENFTNIKEDTETYIQDGITYIIDFITNTAIISSIDSEIKGKVSIPETIPSKNGKEYLVTTMEFTAFWNAEYITEIHFPSSINNIYPNAFIDCLNLVYINIPVNITSIGNLHFNSPRLYIIESQALIPPTEDKAFDSTTFATTKLRVPKGALEKYQKANGWKEFSDIKEGSIETYSKDGISYLIDFAEESAFIVNASDTIKGSVTIPENIPSKLGTAYPVTTIGKNAFEDCCNITELHLPSTITTIGDYAFAYCSNLGYINIPENTESIGEYVFDGCNSLQTIDSYATNPPTVTGEGLNWDENFYTDVTVIVPSGSLDKYKADPIWGKFTNIKENTATAVDQVPDAPAFTIKNGKIITEGPVSIYNLVGQDVTAQNGSLKGIYILVQDGKVAKVMVK